VHEASGQIRGGNVRQKPVRGPAGGAQGERTRGTAPPLQRCLFSCAHGQ
jgi:hypothetical protein